VCRCLSAYKPETTPQKWKSNTSRKSSVNPDINFGEENSKTTFTMLQNTDLVNPSQFLHNRRKLGLLFMSKFDSETMAGIIPISREVGLQGHGGADRTTPSTGVTALVLTVCNCSLQKPLHRWHLPTASSLCARTKVPADEEVCASTEGMGIC
jgi:hypothetical protein